EANLRAGLANAWHGESRTALDQHDLGATLGECGRRGEPADAPAHHQHATNFAHDSALLRVAHGKLRLFHERVSRAGLGRHFANRAQIALAGEHDAAIARAQRCDEFPRRAVEVVRSNHARNEPDLQRLVGAMRMKSSARFAGRGSRIFSMINIGGMPSFTSSSAKRVLAAAIAISERMISPKPKPNARPLTPVISRPGNSAIALLSALMLRNASNGEPLLGSPRSRPIVKSAPVPESVTMSASSAARQMISSS